MRLRPVLLALPGFVLALGSMIAGSLLGAWMGVLLAYASHFSCTLHEPRAQLRPFRRWMVLVGLCIGFIAHVTWRVTTRQGSNTLERAGVFLLNDSAETRLGVARPGLDVRLESEERGVEGWELRVKPTPSGYAVTAVEGVDWIERRRPSGGVSTIWGAELSRASREIALRDARGQRHRLQLLAFGVRGGLEVDGQEFRFDDPEEVHDQRLRRALRMGTDVGVLDAGGALSPGLARCIRLSLDAEGILVGRLAVRWPRARVAAREPECVLEPLDTASNREFAAGDTLRVVTNGRAWRFVISDEGRVDGRRGIRVSFVRRPRPRLASIPTRSVCGAGVACAIVTTRNLPPPVAQLFLGDVGLDTARYGLLGRLEQGADSARLVQRSGATVLRYNQLTSVAAERLHGQVDAGYLLRVGRVNVGSVVDLVLPIVALVVLWIGTGWALLRIDVFRDLLIAQTARARLAWSLLSAITILGSLRLALGLRSALAEPYNERGEATAIGLWIALPLTLLVLVGTVALWPRLVERIERLAIGGNHGAEPAPRMEARPSTERRRVTLDLGTFLILLALALLAWRERDALQGAAVVVASVLLTWIGFGLSRPSESRRLRRADPLSTLLVPPPESAQLRGLLHTALFVILISLAFYRKALALLITIGAVLTVVVLAALIVRTWRRPGSRDAATTFARMRGVESALMLAVLSGVSLLVGGPFSLFAAVFVLYLLAARVGMIHGWRRLALSRWPVDTTGTPASSSGEHGQGTALAGRAWRRIVTAGVRRHMLDAFVLLLPFICLVPVAILDFGLGLICLVPLLATVLLAADVTRFSRPLQLFALGFVMAVMAAVRPVLFPDTRALHEADTFLARDSAFHHIGGASGQAARLLGAEGAFARATVRSIAARDPEALEKVLVAARPSVARDEILRSIEQAWGGRVYAASGWGGEGLARAPLEGRGISRPTALAENVFATFIASEHGLLGVLGVLSVYLYIVVVVFAWFLATSAEESAAGLSSARQALVLGGTLWLTVPTAYVAMGNLGVVPLTGQNIPFLGLNSWSDVLFCVAICSTLLLAILFGEREGEP